MIAYAHLFMVVPELPAGEFGGDDLQVIRYMAWGLIAFGGLFLGWAAYRTLKQTWFRMNAEASVGVLVELQTEKERNTKDGPQTACYGIVEFADHSGQKHRVKSATAVINGVYGKIGEKIVVRYDRDHPEEAKLERFAEMWGLVIALMVFGGGFAGAGMLMLYLNQPGM